jgi:NADPH:quinone reductase-like Zn-dependent oxidoreductase
MKQYELTTGVGIDGLALRDVREPEQSIDRVIVKIHACSLNYRDVMIAAGIYGKTLREKIVPLSDCSGEVGRAGDMVEGLKVGDRVAANFFEGWISGRMMAPYAMTAMGGDTEGVLTEYRSFAPQSLVRIPDSLSFVEAACFPCAGVTAWHALHHRVNLQSGEQVLLLGTGGVSIFGLQIAVAKGASAIVLSSHDLKLLKAMQMGSRVGINYRDHPSWEAKVMEASPSGVDVVLETVGVATLDKSMKSARVGGHICLIGRLDTSVTEANPFRLAMKNQTMHGIYVGSASMLAELFEFYTKNELKPVVDQVFPLEEAKRAYRHIDSGSHFGKVAIQLG